MNPPARLRFETASARTWKDLEALFGRSGAYGGCWCMWWRVPRGGEAWREVKRRGAKGTLRSLLRRGRALGVLAYAGRRPVGWVTLGPRRSFARLQSLGAYRRDDVDRVWSIPCFFVARTWRRRGVAEALLGAAVEAGRRRGARILEGYPRTRWMRTGVFAFRGTIGMFRRLGFRRVPGTRKDQPLVRLALGRGG